MALDCMAQLPVTPCLLLLLVAAIGCQGSRGPQLDDSQEKFVAAQQALATGDTGKAMELLTASIEARPGPWAYYVRAKLYAEAADDANALADCGAGLELDPENSDLKWLRDEIKKPPGQRFQGKNAEPPRANK